MNRNDLIPPWAYDYDKNYRAGLAVSMETRIKTRQIECSTGKVVSETPWKKNLVLDAGLNSLAQKAGTLPASTPASCFGMCQAGSGTNPVAINSGAITFTQTASTTCTASAGFFTAAMVGCILKYGASGSGGTEVYITAFTNSTTVTVGTSLTIGPLQGTVWFVQQTGLQTFVMSTTTYDAGGGSNSTVFSTNTVTMQRTFNFAVQGSTVTINEIGYSTTSSPTTVCVGRLVLPSSDVIPNTNFYQVVLQIQFTYTPGSPTSVGNVGTNINTAGTAMIEFWAIGIVTSTGSISNTNAYLDGTLPNFQCTFKVGAYTQLGSISSSSGASWATGSTVSVSNQQSWAYVNTSLGQMRVSWLTGSTSTTGQTCVGMGVANGTNCLFDVLFTTGQALPNGTFAPQVVMQVQYARVLTN